jgi:hypothetical protein
VLTPLDRREASKYIYRVDNLGIVGNRYYHFGGSVRRRLGLLTIGVRGAYGKEKKALASNVSST